MNLFLKLSREGHVRYFLPCLAILAVLICWPTFHGVVLAQDDEMEDEYEEDEEYDDSGSEDTAATSSTETKGPTYVLPYSLVLACVGLGMFLVCRSSGRRTLTKKWKSKGLLDSDDDDEEEMKGPAIRTKQRSKDAQSGLTLSIVGFLPVVGLFIGPVGLWKSMQAKKAIAQNSLLTGEGIAMAGIIVGAISIVVQIVLIIILVMNML